MDAFPYGNIADVADVEGGGDDDVYGVGKWQEELLPATEVFMHHVIFNGKNRNKQSHGGKDNADSQTAKDLVAILE